MGRTLRKGIVFRKYRCDLSRIRSKDHVRLSLIGYVKPLVVWMLFVRRRHNSSSPVGMCTGKISGNRRLTSMASFEFLFLPLLVDAQKKRRALFPARIRNEGL